MTSKHSINRTLVTIKRKSLNSIRYASEIPGTSNRTIKSEFGDNAPSTSFITNPRAFVSIKQEIKPEPNVKIKCEFSNVNSHNAPIQNQASVKMEKKDLQSSLSQWKMPKPQIDSKDITTFYKCCNIKFYDKILHFRHMLGHMEEEMTCVKIKCYYCTRFFKTENDMIRHAKSKHTGFKCMSCFENFPKKHFLVQHLILVHKYKPRKNENLNHNNLLRWHRKMWDMKSIILHGEIIKKSEELKLKIEHQLSHIKTEQEISNAKLEPTFTSKNIKMEF